MSRLRDLLLGPPSPDGMGQGLIEDIRWLARHRRARRRSVTWRTPSDAAARWWRQHPRFGRFADDCVALAEVDERRWAVMERDWHGWPDPPRFVWFAIGADEGVHAAADFAEWPAAWGPMPCRLATTTPPP